MENAFMKKKFIGFLAGVMLLFVTAGTGCSAGSMQYDRYDNANLYQSGDFTYTATAITEIEIDWMVGGVTLVQSDSAELSVSESGISLNEEQKLHYWIDGSTLNIKFCKAGWRGGNIEEKNKELTVQIPQGVDLEVANISGKIVAENLSVGELSVESVSGDITLKSVTAREVSAESVSGGIAINGLETGELNIDQVSGDIELSMLSAMEIELETVSGKTTLTLDASQGANISFEGASGKLRSDKEYTKNGERYSFAGESGVLRIDAESASGDFIVK